LTNLGWLKERKWIAAQLRGEKFGFEGLDWETICEICQWEGIGPILYTVISKENSADIPEEAKSNLKALYFHSHFRNLYFLKELRELLGLFNKSKIPVMLLKGAALLSTVYDNPAHRPMSDIDFMIREEDLEKAHLLILKKGYKLIGLEYWPWWRKFGGERSYIKDRIRIDLHWHLECFVKRSASKNMFARAKKVNIQGAEALIPFPEELLLHTLHHMVYQHFHLRLIWLFDILKITTIWKEEIDWKRVYGQAKESKLVLPLFFGLKEVKALFGAPIPEELIKENPPSYRWLNYFLKFQGRTEIGGNLIKLIMLPGIINKFIFLLGALFPSPDFLQTRYQTKRKTEAYLYFFLRPFLIAHKCIKELYPVLS